MLLAAHFVSAFDAIFASVARQIEQYFHTHGLLLTVCEIPITRGKFIDIRVLDGRDPIWIHWYELVLDL